MLEPHDPAKHNLPKNWWYQSYPQKGWSQNSFKTANITIWISTQHKEKTQVDLCIGGFKYFILPFLEAIEINMALPRYEDVVASNGFVRTEATQWRWWGNYLFLFAYDMEDTLMYFLVESCKEIRDKRSTTGNSKHMNAKHGKIGRITEVDVHIISVRISFFPKKPSTSTGCFFQVHTVPFTRCPLTQKPPIFAPLHQWWDWWYCHVLPWKLAFGNKRNTWILQWVETSIASLW